MKYIRFVNRPLFAALITTAVFLSSCSYIKRTTNLFEPEPVPVVTDTQEAVNLPPAKEKPARHTTKVNVEKLDTEKEQQAELEIIWKIPEAPVDGFIIYYGYSPDQLDNSVTLNTAEIEKIDHPDYGYVYRYRIKNIPSDKTVYIAMASVKDGHSSEKSKPVEIKPGQQRVVSK